MYLENEFKFLVKSLDQVDLVDVERKLHRQAYLNINDPNFVQARISANITDETARLNLKGPRVNAVRPEYESKMNFNTAMDIICKSNNQIIKTRHYYEKDLNGYEWVIDEYHGANEGLLIAELEVEINGSLTKLPSSHIHEWAYLEVTNDESFYNYFLSRFPIKDPIWKLWNKARRYFVTEHSRYENLCANEFERLNMFLDIVFEKKDEKSIELLLKALRS